MDVPALLEVGESFAQGQLGIEPEALKAFRWLKRGSHIWAHDLEEWPYPNWEENGGWRMVALGLRALDLSGKGPPRPSNDLLGRVDDAITKGRVELTADAWLSLMEDGTIEVEGPDGLVALCWGDEVLARGFRRDGVIRHEVPKGRFNWLRNVMKGIAAGGS